MASMLRKNLTCGVCNQVFTVPVILPCMHTFCKNCITPLISSEMSPEITHEVDSLDGESDDLMDKGPSIQCPTCDCISTLEKGVESLQLNITFDNITKKYKKNLKESTRVLCDICDASESVYATKSCVQCRLSYCESCVENFHPSKGKLTKHILCEPIPDFGEKTSDIEQILIANGNGRGDNFVTGFCTDCRATFKTYDESGSSHKDHVYMDCKLAKAAQMASLEVLENQLQYIKEDYIRRIKIAETETEGFEIEEQRRISNVKKSLNSLRSLIDEKEHALVVQIKSETFQSSKDRTKFIQDLQTVLGNVRHGINDVRNTLDEEFQKLTMEELIEVEERISRCKAIPDTLNYQKSESPKPHLDTQQIEDMLNALSFRQTGLPQMPPQFVYQGLPYMRNPNPQNVGYYGFPLASHFPNQVPGHVFNSIPNMGQFPVAQPQQLQNPTIPVMPLMVPQNAEKLKGAIDQMALESILANERKQKLGESLFPLVKKISPDLAGKITGMLLDLNDLEILQLLQSKDKLQQRVRQAIDALQEHERRIQNLQSPNKENSQEKNNPNLQSPNEDNNQNMQSRNTESPNK